jgi:LmbE family N-acetylglucosaminyl deacetylase
MFVRTILASAVIAACAVRPQVPPVSVQALLEQAARAARAACDRKLEGEPPSRPGSSTGYDVVLYTAHPDDEAMYAGGTMDRLVRARRRVAFVAFTHGEGGRILERNADGAVVPRRDYPRGHVVALRDAEMEAAARAIGVDAAHLHSADPVLDFGKTTSCVETLDRWNASAPGGLPALVRGIVADVRRRRPRVVITLDPRDDPESSHHGHHKAVGALVAVAARLAADPRIEAGPIHVVEELLTTAPAGVPADVEIEVDVAARRKMLEAYPSQFVPEELASNAIANRPREGFVVVWGSSLVRDLAR